jgi:PhnB protein
MHIEPYLFFNGHCDEAIEFYRRALGAEVTMLMRFKESPDAAANPPGSDDKVMHASLRIGDTTVLASDGHSTGKPSFQGFALQSLSLRPLYLPWALEEPRPPCYCP